MITSSHAPFVTDWRHSATIVHSSTFHSLRESALFLLSIFLVILLCLAFVGTRIEVLRTGYRLSDAREANRTLLRENSQLLVESATLKSPERIEKIAVTELGMIYPDRNQVIQLSE